MHSYKEMHFSSFQFVAMPLIALDNKDLVKNQKNVASNWWWFVWLKSFLQNEIFLLIIHEWWQIYKFFNYLYIDLQVNK